MTSLGGAAILGGAATLLPGALLESDDVVLAGGVLLGAGAGVLTGGIIALVLSRTSVEVTAGSSGSKDNTPDAASVFEIDKRAVARAPRYWLGEL